MIAIGLPQIVVLLVAVQRLAELAVAARNTRRLLAAGGREHGGGHYPLLVGLHAAWLAALFVAADAVAHPWLLGVFVALQAARLWVVLTLGRFWTTRVISHPDWPLVRRGPFRLLRHPNYAVVVAEIAVLPAAFGLWWLALGFSLANAAVLAIRLRVEGRALAARADQSTPDRPAPDASPPSRQ